MTTTWPDIRIPAPDGPAAREHLRRIAEAARNARSPWLTDIEKAVEACEKEGCLQPGNPPQRGRPPAPRRHGDAILAARLHAGDRPDWDKCLAALRHGEPLQEQARKARA
jgi:hypothetical protein